MGDRRGIRSGSFFRTIEPLQLFTQHLADGLIATDGIQRSSVATVGTAPVTVFSKLIDPGFDLALKEIEISLTQRFDNLLATSVGSLFYYWQMRREALEGTVGAWVNITGTYSKGVPTSGVSGDPSEDTFSGYVPVGSIPDAPLRLQLIATAIVAASFAADVKNSSYIKLVGSVIPGS